MALRHPIAVSPGVIEVPDDRGSSWRFFVVLSEGISLIGDMTMMMGDDVILVQRPSLHARHEAFPDSGAAARKQAVSVGIPVVEITHDEHLARIRRPKAETSA